ncbi:MAG: glycerophosphodiester phosphodiesterase family protein [Mycobacteriales bacterium]
MTSARIARLRSLCEPGLPAVIAHRGASGYRPEHTIAGYRLAIALGADYIEPDLVPTRDGVLVARHENDIATTTDVAARPEFADRRTTRIIDGDEVTGWFTEYFSYPELRTLRARERLAWLRPDSARRDGRYRVPSFGEILDLARWESWRRGRPIGVYPELKHPSYFASIGLATEPLLMRTLASRQPSARHTPVVVQCFEAASLRLLRPHLRNPQVLLLEAPPAEPLADIARYADAIGPDKSLVIPRGADGRLARPTSLVDDAHAAGLAVHAYTFRSENAFLAGDFTRGEDPAAGGDAVGELVAYLRTGIDGVFSDQVDTAVAARASLRDQATGGPLPAAYALARAAGASA